MVTATEQQLGREGIAPASWLLAADACPEQYQGAQHDTLRFMGSIAIRGEAPEDMRAQETVNETTLLAATQLAALGDEASLRVVRTNVATDVAERLFKAAHQTTITMKMVNGRLQQEGRLLTDIHKNTLEQTILNEEMLRRTKHELANVQLFQRLHAKGLLTDHDAVVFSPASTAMSEAQKKQYGFFVATETCSIQRLSAEGDDITLQTAFVAGKRTPTSKRHDIAAIWALAAERDVILPTDDATELVQHVMLIPKRDITDVADVVSWYDRAAGGTFYGLDMPARNYRAYALECQQRSEGFDGMVSAITAQLLREAHTFRNPMDAILRLDALSEEYCVERAVVDSSIDEAVFGSQAAMHIQEARFFAELGDVGRAQASLHMAKQTANSSSCPLFKNLGGGNSSPDDTSGSESASEGESKDTLVTCPYCRSKVYCDPCATVISCSDCTALVMDGKVKSKGNGGRKQRVAQMAAAIDALFAELQISFDGQQPTEQPAQSQPTPALASASA